MQMHMYVQGGVKLKIEYFGYFCEVVESQGISLAAQKMYISQQGLSKALNVIESEFGTTLLNRNRNSGSVSLTAEGQIFYDYASSIWKEYSRMCTVFQSLKGKQSGGEKVTICGTKFLLNNVLTPVFHTMTATGKELPQILEKSIDEIFSGLDSQPSNQLNIVNIPEYTFSEIKRNSDLCFVALYSSSLMAYLYKNNPMSSKKCISLDELSTVPLAIYQDDNLLEMLHHLLGTDKLGNIKFITSNARAIRQFMRENQCISITDSYLERFDKRSSFISIPLKKSIVIHQGFIYSRKNPPSTNAMQMIDTITKIVGNLK